MLLLLLAARLYLRNKKMSVAACCQNKCTYKTNHQLGADRIGLLQFMSLRNCCKCQREAVVVMRERERERENSSRLWIIGATVKALSSVCG
jgi:hypothetical protein